MGAGAQLLAIAAILANLVVTVVASAVGSISASNALSESYGPRPDWLTSIMAMLIAPFIYATAFAIGASLRKHDAGLGNACTWLSAGCSFFTTWIGVQFAFSGDRQTVPIVLLFGMTNILFSVGMIVWIAGEIIREVSPPKRDRDKGPD